MDSEAHVSDEELVNKTLLAKEEFGQIMERYEAPLTRYVRRLGVRNHDDILDILQEIFISVYRNLNDFDTTLKFSSWIYRIAHNETMDWFRRRSARPEGYLVENGDEIMELLSSDEWGSDERLSQSLNAEVLGRALDTLEPKYREVIVLRFFEHKEYDEISDILRIPIGTVGTLLFRAKEQLRKSLAQYQLNI